MGAVPCEIFKMLIDALIETEEDILDLIFVAGFLGLSGRVDTCILCSNGRYISSLSSPQCKRP